MTNEQRAAELIFNWVSTVHNKQNDDELLRLQNAVAAALAEAYQSNDGTIKCYEKLRQEQEAEAAALRERLDELEADNAKHKEHALLYQQERDALREAQMTDERWKIIKGLLTFGDLPAPEILLNEDGEIDLDWWGEASLTITPSITFAWAILGGAHGTYLDEFKKALLEHKFKPSNYQEMRKADEFTKAARIEGLRRGREIVNEVSWAGVGDDYTVDRTEILDLIDAEIAALERGKE